MVDDETIKAHYHTIYVLKKGKPKLRKAIISNCNQDLVYGISTCILTFLSGNIPLSGRIKRKLKKHRAVLRQLADNRVRQSAKKQLVVQIGGFLLPLLSAALPTVPSEIFCSRATSPSYVKCFSFLPSPDPSH